MKYAILVLSLGCNFLAVAAEDVKVEEYNLGDLCRGKHVYNYTLNVKYIVRDNRGRWEYVIETDIPERQIFSADPTETLEFRGCLNRFNNKGDKTSSCEVLGIKSDVKKLLKNKMDDLVKLVKPVVSKRTQDEKK